MQVRFNINDTIKVKLNEGGEQILKEEHDDLNELVMGGLGEYKPRKKDKDGYVKMQIWEFMQIFGNRVYLAGELPFDTELRLEGN